ncbi:transposase [Nonomuraea sp. NPDC049714]|uniref:transposase n=1 Tax=Nonomuraea sp. NPDC049714 TaxID=3364357 RepID=UPI00379D15D9
MIKPAPLRPAVPRGFDLDDFTIDTAAGVVTCPSRHIARLTGNTDKKRAIFGKVCDGCPLRQRCTIAKNGRIVQIRPQHDLQAAARRQAATDPDWQADYRRWRPPVERAVAWIVARGNRRYGG